MSIRALAYTARDIIRRDFPLDHALQCDVMRDGRPPYSSPDQFISVWGSQWSPGPFPNMEQGLNEHMGVTFTVSFAIGVAPDDRLAEELIYKACVGIEQWARRVMFLMTAKRWEWLCAANAMIQEEACGCDGFVPIDLFHSPPVWSGTDSTPRLVMADWWSAEPPDPDDDEDLTKQFGMTMDVRFADAARTTSLENMGV